MAFALLTYRESLPWLVCTRRIAGCINRASVAGFPAGTSGRRQLTRRLLAYLYAYLTCLFDAMADLESASGCPHHGSANRRRQHPRQITPEAGAFASWTAAIWTAKE